MLKKVKKRVLLTLVSKTTAAALADSTWLPVTTPMEAPATAVTNITRNVTTTPGASVLARITMLTTCTKYKKVPIQFLTACSTASVVDLRIHTYFFGLKNTARMIY